MDCLFLPADCGSRIDSDTRVYWLPGEGDDGWMPLANVIERASAAVTLVLPAEV